MIALAVDTSVVSVCCAAYPVAGTEVSDDGIGLCGQCHEWAGFEDSEEQE